MTRGIVVHGLVSTFHWSKANLLMVRKVRFFCSSGSPIYTFVILDDPCIFLGSQWEVFYYCLYFFLVPGQILSFLGLVSIFHRSPLSSKVWSSKVLRSLLARARVLAFRCIPHFFWEDWFSIFGTYDSEWRRNTLGVLFLSCALVSALYRRFGSL